MVTAANSINKTKALSVQETAELTRCEDTIEKGFKSFIAVGSALVEIRDKELYRAQFTSFEAYIEARWKITRQRAYQLITAGSMSTRVDIENEAQARQLKRLPEELQPVAWDMAKENSQRIMPGKPVSTRILKATVNVLKDAEATGGCVDIGDGQMTALDAAITQEAYELSQRQSQHIQDSVKAKAESQGRIEVFKGHATLHSVSQRIDAFTVIANNRDDLVDLKDVKPGAKLWVIVYEVKESENGRE